MSKYRQGFRKKASNKPLHTRKAVSVDYSKVKSRSYVMGPRTVLAFLHPKYMTTQEFSEFINRAAADVLGRFGIDTIVVGVEHWSEMRVLDVKDMNGNGWFHKDQIFMLKSQVDLSQNSAKEISAFIEQYVAMDEEE